MEQVINNLLGVTKEVLSRGEPVGALRWWLSRTRAYRLRFRAAPSTTCHHREQSSTLRGFLSNVFGLPVRAKQGAELVQ